MTLLSIASKILSTVLQLLGIAQFLQGDTTDHARETIQGLVQLDGEINKGILTSATFGNEALAALLNSLAAQLTATTNALGILVAQTQQTGSPVTLPTIPPPGYSAPSTSAIGAEVWGYAFPGVSSSSGELLQFAALPQYNMAQNEAWPWYQSKLMRLSGDMTHEHDVGFPSSAPQIDVSTILATDTVLTWANRENDQGLVFTLNGQGLAAAPSQNSVAFHWLIWLRPDEFNALKPVASATATVYRPPVWPGPAHATLGAPVSVTGAFKLAGPMSGLLVALTSVPAKFAFFDYDGVVSYRNIGAITFEADGAGQEFPQLLGLAGGLYTPHTMTIAKSVSGRLAGGVQATLTPFTITL